MNICFWKCNKAQSGKLFKYYFYDDGNEVVKLTIEIEIDGEERYKYKYINIYWMNIFWFHSLFFLFFLLGFNGKINKSLKLLRWSNKIINTIKTNMWNSLTIKEVQNCWFSRYLLYNHKSESFCSWMLVSFFFINNLNLSIYDILVFIFFCSLSCIFFCSLNFPY